ncbi:hypothetical protein MKEN_00425400 [Mycena kentingensis (nom. inval.)]|nr:hypothetical protein MKEN_00425400 [Mycena kentingensis (nom. inval.)]
MNRLCLPFRPPLIRYLHAKPSKPPTKFPLREIIQRRRERKPLPLVEGTADELNAALLFAAVKERVAYAEHLRHHIAASGFSIHPHAYYEHVALAYLRFHGRRSIPAFLDWLLFVPDNKQPATVEGGPLTQTRNLLFRTGKPTRNIQLLSRFCIVAASKGYGNLVWDDLMRVLPFQQPDTSMVFLLEHEAALLDYYRKNFPLQVYDVAYRERNKLFRLCFSLGWIEQAVGLVKISGEVRIGASCRRLVAILRGRERKDLIAKVIDSLAANRALSASGQSKLSIPGMLSGWVQLPPRSTIAADLRQLKLHIAKRDLIPNRPPGRAIHSFIAQYEASKGYRHGLTTLRKRALSKTDQCAYTWLVKEMFHLRATGRFVDTIALFDLNFYTNTFFPTEEWQLIRDYALPRVDPAVISSTVPTRLHMRPADAWMIWNALVRVSVLLPADSALPTLRTLRDSLTHYATRLSNVQFRATPTSYPSAYRSIIWAFGQLGQTEEAVATATDVVMIGKAHERNVVLLDEVAAVHARAGNIEKVQEMLDSLDALGPRVQTYGLVMDAYLKRGLIEEAMGVEDRMLKKCKYEHGQNWRLDRTLATLAALNAEEGVT